MSGVEVAGRWDAIQLDPRDNVATVLRGLGQDSVPRIAGSAGEAPRLIEPISRGHKFALVAIAAGETVYKYGAPIGSALEPIAAGAHVHLHNLEGFAGREARRRGSEA